LLQKQTFLGGDKPPDYYKTPQFVFESAFLSSDREKLYVLLSTASVYRSCSFSMASVEKHFDEIWGNCQNYKNREDFQLVSFGRVKEVNVL
jgi:hypothetical protein